jgi:murein L,D-transpeptidase YcbB/YkuD
VKLEIALGDGRTRHLVLAGIDSKHAVIRIGGVREQIAIGDLTLHAQPEQLLLFRPAVTDEANALKAGARGAGVIWLRTTLASISGLDPAAEQPDLFDEPLADAVRTYQRDRGLFVDGIVGDRTLISLQNEIGLVGASLVAGMH